MILPLLLASLVPFTSVSVSALVPPRHVTFASLNTTVLAARPVPYDPRNRTDATWVITSSCCGYGMFTPEAVANASSFYGLFDVPCGWPDMPAVGEWGYEFHNNQQGVFSECGNLTMAGYQRPPVSRDDALDRLALYWACRARDARNDTHSGPTDPVFSMIGHYLYAGLSGVFEGGPGRVIPGSEIGENINSINAHLAASRGAARQFASPFIIDFSAWFQGYIRDFSASKFWGSASSPVGGHSLSLFRRSYFSAFLAGAGGLIAEAGAVNYFMEATTSAGVLELSPLGEIGQEVFAFSHGNGNADPESVRGIPYVPVALVTEEPHGMGLGFFYNGKAWDTFPLAENEKRTFAWLDAQWPGSWTVESDFHTSSSESRYMVGSQFGETVDLLLPVNLSSSLLLGASYRAVILVGAGADAFSDARAKHPRGGSRGRSGQRMALQSSLCEGIVDYVSQGGLVVLAADEIVGSQQCSSPSFLGLTLSSSATTVSAASIEDTQTGWISIAPDNAPFCVGDDAGANFYIKTGGDPAKTSGWDGGKEDKCCSHDAADCIWFGSLSSCQASLPLTAGLCRACEEGSVDAGCPSWPRSTGGSVPITLQSTSAATTAIPLLRAVPTSGEPVPIAYVNSFGQGIVVTLLASNSAMLSGSGFGLAAHLLGRFFNDSAPFDVATNSTSGTLQMFVSRTVSGWNITLINNNGVVKQPETEETVDSSKDLQASLSLRVASGASGNGRIHRAWYSLTGNSAPLPLPCTDGVNLSEVLVPAGGLCTIGVELMSE